MRRLKAACDALGNVPRFTIATAFQAGNSMSGPSGETWAQSAWWEGQPQQPALGLGSLVAPSVAHLLMVADPIFVSPYSSET